MAIDRRLFLAVAAAMATNPGRSAAQTFRDLARPRTPASEEESLVLRRPRREREDRDWYVLTQRGPLVPAPKPVTIPFGRGRIIVHWPKDTDQGHLVVFSHAALADPMLYRPLLQHWASHGFVVVAPIHDDSLQERGLLTRRATGIGSAVWEVDRILNDVVAWSDRVQQCTDPLDNAELIGKAINMKVLTERPVIAGHDFGAYVTQLSLGTQVVTDSTRPFLPNDDRWFGGIAMSPQGPGIMGLSEDSWKNLKRPLLVIESAREQDFTGQSALDKIAPYTRSAPGYKHLAWFEQATRSMYTGNVAQSGDNKAETLAIEDLKAVTTAFLIAYSKYDREMFERIQLDWPQGATHNRVTSRHR